MVYGTMKTGRREGRGFVLYGNAYMREGGVCADVSSRCLFELKHCTSRRRIRVLFSYSFGLYYCVLCVYIHMLSKNV